MKFNHHNFPDWKFPQLYSGYIGYSQRIIHEISCRGPWDHEPDYAYARGETNPEHILLVVRMPRTGGLNGYVNIQYCPDVNVLDTLKIHGGVNYSRMIGKNTPILGGGATNIVRSHISYTVGFDTAGGLDFLPFKPDPFGGQEYRDMAYVLSETRKLSEGLALVEKSYGD